MLGRRGGLTRTAPTLGRRDCSALVGRPAAVRPGRDAHLPPRLLPVMCLLLGGSPPSSAPWSPTPLLPLAARPGVLSSFLLPPRTAVPDPSQGPALQRCAFLCEPRPWLRGLFPTLKRQELPRNSACLLHRHGFQKRLSQCVAIAGIHCPGTQPSCVFFCSHVRFIPWHPPHPQFTVED